MLASHHHFVSVAALALASLVTASAEAKDSKPASPEKVVAELAASATLAATPAPSPTPAAPSAAPPATTRGLAAAAPAVAVKPSSKPTAAAAGAPEASAEEALAGEPTGVIQAIKTLRATGETPVVAGEVLRYPYGHGQPALQCLPLRACDIELQPGEAVTGVALGDSERWEVEPLESGDPSHPTPHVILKPTEAGLVTNLIIGTNRRTYHLSVESPSAHARAARDRYVRRLSFYYPDELVARWQAATDLRRNAAAQAARVTAFVIPKDPTGLNFNYTVGGDRLRWRPVRAFDDGAHTYLQFPRALEESDAPVLLAKTDSGGFAVVNYRSTPDGHWYIADGLWSEVQLVVGTGRGEKRVVITNRSYAR